LGGGAPGKTGGGARLNNNQNIRIKMKDFVQIQVWDRREDGVTVEWKKRIEDCKAIAFTDSW
jgi:hypothetical protein